MAINITPVNGRLELTTVSVRLGKIENGIAPDEAANMAQLNAATDRITALETGTKDIDRIEFSASGTATVPVLTWDGDTDTGVYRIGANNVGITAGGTKIVDVTTAGASVTGTFSASTTVTATTSFLSGDGTVGAPSHTFTSDTDTGVYRIGANNIGIAVGATKIVDIASSGVAITGTLSATTTVTATTLLISGDGTVSAPAHTFTNDLDCGLYRIGVNNIGFAIGGNKIIDIATTGVTITGASSTSTTFQTGDGAVGAPAQSFLSDTDCGTYRIGANNLGVAVNGAKVLDIATTGLAVTGLISATTSIAATTTVTATTLFFSGDGTVAAPTYSFVSDTDSGIYRIGANNIGVAVNGAKVLDIAITGTTTTGTVSTSAGFLYTASITTSGAGTPQTLNQYAGTVTMTGIADMAAGATTSVVINNSLVTASTVGGVWIQTTTAAAGSTPRIETTTYGAGTITLALRNSAAATATGASTYVFSFILFKL